MKRYFIGFLMLFMFCPKVSAAICDNARFVSYQDKAKNITYSYDYVDESNTFNITLTNVSSDFYLLDLNSNVTYPYTSDEMVLSGMTPGKTYKLAIYTENDIYCSDKRIYTLYIKLPYYNPYYNDELCSDIKEFQFCKKFITKMITYDEFKEKVNTYKNQIEKGNTSDESEEYVSIFRRLLNFYTKYYYVILPSIIILGLVIRWRYNKKNDLF